MEHLFAAAVICTNVGLCAAYLYRQGSKTFQDFETFIWTFVIVLVVISLSALAARTALTSGYPIG